MTARIRQRGLPSCRLVLVKAFFKEIRHGEIEAVRSRLDASPALIAATAKAPPKKDDGQSPLQVAIKTGHFDIAHLLLERGADVDFMESSTLNRWNVPVLHDAIRAAVFSARFGRDWALPGEPPSIEVMNTEEQFNRAFDVLERLLESGADVSKLDSVGNPALLRAILDARQIMSEPPPHQLMEDLQRVFSALMQAGANPGWVDPRSQQPLTDEVAGTSLRRLLP
jgi:ankyrin repeat protein